MTSAFIETAHDGVQHLRGNDYLFYYGVKPAEVHLLRIGAEFSVVYTWRWKVVQYQVLANGPGLPNAFVVVKERPLQPDEIEYFKALVAEL